MATDFWDQFPLHDDQASVSFDPAQASANTGINGGGGMPDAGIWPSGPGSNPAFNGASPTGTQTLPNGVNLDASGNWSQQAFEQAFGRPGTPQELTALEPQLQAAGIKVLRNAAGVAGKIQLPNGQIVDVINSAGAGGNGFQWLTGGGGGGGLGAGSNLASLGYGFGSSMAPWNEQFSAPDPSKIANDPYYQFQFNEGMKGIQGSAAAKGTLLTGGTLKALEGYGQGLASSFGDKAYDRGMGEYLLRRDNFFQNEDRPFSKNLSLAQLGKPT